MGSGSSAHRNPFKRSDDKKDNSSDDKKNSPGPSKSKENVISAKFKVKEEPKPAKPTTHQIERWTSSINSLLSDEQGLLAFEEFLKEAELEEGEFCRYIHFYKECIAYKQKFCELEMQANQIFEKYLQVNSEQQIGTGGKGVEVGEKLGEGFSKKSLFDDSLQKVIDQLDRTHYVNFCKEIKRKYL